MNGVKIHESAIVDDGAQIGKGSRVWHFVHICQSLNWRRLFVWAKRFRGKRCKHW